MRHHVPGPFPLLCKAARPTLQFTLASGYRLESIVLRNPNRTTTMSMDAIPDSECFLESYMITVIVRLHLQNTFRGR